MDDPHVGSSRFLGVPRLDLAAPSARQHSMPAATGPAKRAVAGLRQLLQSWHYAEDVGADVWQFAVDLAELKSLGLTSSDLRWLILKGYADHARETTLPGDAQRSFRQTPSVAFSKRTCFVIKASGIEAARVLSSAAEISPLLTLSEHDDLRRADIGELRPAPVRRASPHWDADLQELRVNGVIIKQFKVPAPNQEMILAAFQEEAWPARIDDPLPPHPDQDPKRRLHDTIVSLNRNHKSRLIRFMGDGSGQGVRWTIVTGESS